MTTWLFLAGAAANILGGIASDWLVKKAGLKAARRIVLAVGAAVSEVCLTLSLLVGTKYLVMALLSLSYCGLMFAQGVLSRSPHAKYSNSI